MSFELPALPYAYDALEPHIDARTMEIHHTKHHAGYTNKLNTFLEENTDYQGQSIEELLSSSDMPNPLRNNGGGYFNHCLFWKLLTPEQQEPQGELLEAINNGLGGLDALKEEFNKAAATRFGSGWAWLSVDQSGALKVHSTANQDTPLELGLKPVIGLDVWEHAYYLHYQNRRPDYISAFWNVLNWDQANQNYLAAK